MPHFLSCLSSSSTQDTAPLVKASPRAKCTFCSVSTERGFSIVNESPDFIAFRDRSPAAETHLLIVPRKHVVSTVRELTREHVLLIRSLISRAHNLVPGQQLKMGFHIPPFSSVHHLHLHVFAGKPTPIHRFKYPARDGSIKGWSWFVTADQALSIIESGQRIGLGSSKSTKS